MNYFFKCVNIDDIYTFRKKNSKCFDMIPKLTHFDFFFRVRNISKCVVTELKVLQDGKLLSNSPPYRQPCLIFMYWNATYKSSTSTVLPLQYYSHLFFYLKHFGHKLNKVVKLKRKDVAELNMMWIFWHWYCFTLVNPVTDFFSNKNLNQHLAFTNENDLLFSQIFLVCE